MSAGPVFGAIGAEIRLGSKLVHTFTTEASIKRQAGAIPAYTTRSNPA